MNNVFVNDIVNGVLACAIYEIIRELAKLIISKLHIVRHH